MTGKLADGQSAKERCAKIALGRDVAGKTQEGLGLLDTRLARCRSWPMSLPEIEFTSPRDLRRYVDRCVWLGGHVNAGDCLQQVMRSDAEAWQDVQRITHPVEQRCRTVTPLCAQEPRAG